MRVTDILSSPWPIRSQNYLEICNIYLQHCHGEKADIAAIEARLGKPLDNKPPVYTVKNGVAILPVEGIIEQRMSMFESLSGAVSTERISAMLANALGNPQAHSIVLAIDSPGGQVSGVQLLAREIFDARSKKPIVAVTDSMMASAAYWIGSAASKVSIT